MFRVRVGFIKNVWRGGVRVCLGLRLGLPLQFRLVFQCEGVVLVMISVPEDLKILDLLITILSRSFSRIFVRGFSSITKETSANPKIDLLNLALFHLS